jgi:GrpB-like predicted nucleotidyltransferase (UPF0157 family)
VVGAAGTNIVDLAMVVPPPLIDPVMGRLTSRGWQRHNDSWSFPANRPMAKAALVSDTVTWRAHLHIVQPPDLQQLVTFRNALDTSPAFRNEYIAAKRAIVAHGSSTPMDYARAKGRTITELVRR